MRRWDCTTQFYNTLSAGIPLTICKRRNVTCTLLTTRNFSVTLVLSVSTDLGTLTRSVTNQVTNTKLTQSLEFTVLSTILK